MVKDKGRADEYKQYKTKDIAQILGTTDRTIQNLAKNGTLPTLQQKPEYTFDLVPTLQAYIHYLKNQTSGKKPRNEMAQQAEQERLRAEADLKRSKADMAGLQLKEIEGKMHRSEDVEAFTIDLVYTIRAMILALPGRLAMDVVNVKTAAEASALIRSECHKVLNELSNYKYNPENYRRRVRDREGWDNLITDEENQ
jgi:phage terminase Nu1 subunit (DNA packaging protein)